jgi:NitT/TauT family transport system permease protein
MSLDVKNSEAPDTSAAATPATAAPPPAATTKAPRSSAWKSWDALWPKVLAVAIAVGIWQAIVLSGWKTTTILPPPTEALGKLVELLGTSKYWETIQLTMTRGVIGFLAALAVGTILGIACSQWKVLRAAVGSMITGLQTMPSIAWFPLMILFFGLTETAIFAVIILGAAPSVANGILSGIDDTPPQLLRAGHMLGARGWARYRYVILPAALPSYLSGLKQGWAFAWRSLMAGELLVPIAQKSSLGYDMTIARQFLQSDRLIAIMITILVLGMVVDALFSALANRVRRNRGLTGLSATAG